MQHSNTDTVVTSAKVTDEFPWMSQTFVMARPIAKYSMAASDWAKYDGSTSPQGREYRPVMIRGIGTGKRVWVIGSAHGYELDLFEFSGDITVFDPVEKTTTIFTQAAD